MGSASRVMNDVADQRQQRLAGKLKEVLATYRQAEDLINIGAYKAGSNPKIDYAISKIDQVISYHRQAINESVDVDHAVSALQDIFDEHPEVMNVG
jgi:flagellum-specific ATP synthase